ncbi:MAG: hypothetical protein KDI44_13225 [Thiothrix sp.]|nr:hypothetical protein [Thiothrix sp.]
MPDLNLRIDKLHKYEAWLEPTKVDFEAVVGKEKWAQHWQNWELVQNTMRQAQTLATEINQTIAKEYAKL